MGAQVLAEALGTVWIIRACPVARTVTPFCPAMTYNEGDLRRLGHWAAKCAGRVLPLFEAQVPDDDRPRAALAGVRAYARGGKRTNHLRRLIWAAMAAAREAYEPAAIAAARAAYSAASVTFMHARYTPGQEKHALGAAMYAALACELSAGNSAAADSEIRWAIRHASPAVRTIVRRLPPRKPGRSCQDMLYHQLDAGLRGESGLVMDNQRRRRQTGTAMNSRTGRSADRRVTRPRGVCRSGANF